MKKQTFHARVVPGILVACLATASAQVRYSKPPGSGTAGVRTVTPPTAPVTVRPTPPNNPSRPTTLPATPSPPHVIVTPPPMVVVPSQPSAYIGPTIIRTTRDEPAPDTTGQQGSGQPMRLDDGTPPHRLVALIGTLTCQDVTDGGLVESGADQLFVGTGVLTHYATGHGFGKMEDGRPTTGRPLSESTPLRAVGDYFGQQWGDAGYVTNDADPWTRGPILDHPILTINEVTPSAWPFELATSGARVNWMRLAIALHEWDPPSDLDRGGYAPSGGTPPPWPRHSKMAAALNAISWEPGSDVALGAFGPGPGEVARVQTSQFGGFLARIVREDMNGLTRERSESDLIGIAEWKFNTDDLRAIMASCPVFREDTPESPVDAAALRAARARVTDVGSTRWIRRFQLTGDNSNYRGEIWFVIVPDATLATWMGLASTSAGASTGR